MINKLLNEILIWVDIKEDIIKYESKSGSKKQKLNQDTSIDDSKILFKTYNHITKNILGIIWELKTKIKKMYFKDIFQTLKKRFF